MRPDMKPKLPRVVLTAFFGMTAASAHELPAGSLNSSFPWIVPQSAEHATLNALRNNSIPCGNGELLAASFAAFQPKVRVYWDDEFFYEESEGLPDTSLMPDLMVGITSWQQQIPLPTSYFQGTTNPEGNAGSLGYGKPNMWKLPLVPVPSAPNSIPISSGNFQRGAIALAANGIPIFNPRNNRGEFSQAIGELDRYGGHCGLADDYHYHIVPVHLQSVLGTNLPPAWALDGYPIYGYNEPNGSPRLPLDPDGGHDVGNGWGYHYHAIGTDATGPQIPYMMNAFHGTVVNFGGQVDPQPEVRPIRASGTGGYLAKQVPGARITAFKNPVALDVDASGHLLEKAGGTPSSDQYLMRYAVGAASFDICWRIQRNANPKTLTITWRLPDVPAVTTTYNNINNRLTTYPMAASSLKDLPDTGQLLDALAAFGEDSDYALNPPAFRDNGDDTISDLVTGLMWQKSDQGESTWEAAIQGAGTATTGGYTDWRLPTPAEAFSLINHNINNPALDPTYFHAPTGTAPEYWWTSDNYGFDASKVWVINSGGGLGPHPKSETISAGGTHPFHARYVRGARPSNGHHYLNHCDGTVTDLDTGLMWCQIPSPKVSWSNAIAFAENLDFAGYSDWRLPNVKELQSLVDITLATGTSSATALPCLNRLLFPAATPTAYWSSTSLKSGTLTRAWLVEFGINPSVPSASGPTRNSQGIVSYESYTSQYPAFAVRSGSKVEPTLAPSITQGLATPLIANLYSKGQRIAAVGTIQSTNGTVWSVPSATQFQTAPKAKDLYNETTGVLPAGIQFVDVNSVPIVEIDPDGEVITGYLFSDNYFELYVNGTLVGVDPVPYTPFNSCIVRFRAKSPVTYAVKLVDWEENLGLGTELNGGTPYHPGDGGFIASFSDGTVTGSHWKAQAFYIAPVDDPSVVIERPDGTHDSSNVPIPSKLNTLAFALHYPVPTNWFGPEFNDTRWPSASVYSEATVGVDNKPAYQNFPAQFSQSGANFIWSSNLVLDNEVIVRYTAPGAAAKPPSVTEVQTLPLSPTQSDTVVITARIQPDAGKTITRAELSYADGTFTNRTVFSETMAAAPVSPWNGSGADHSWTITSLGSPNTFRQTTAANHGNGNPCGLEFDKGTPNLSDSMATITAPIDATGSSGSVEFWVASRDLISPNGWTFQLSTNGGVTWTTRLSELDGRNHDYQNYHYDLTASERVANLKLRFQFAGYNAVAPVRAPKIDVDDLAIRVVSGNSPVVLTLLDDGEHGDGAPGDGIYGARIPTMTAGRLVTLSLLAIDSVGLQTLLTAPASYRVFEGVPEPIQLRIEETPSGPLLDWNSQPGFMYGVERSVDLRHWTPVMVGQTNTWIDSEAVASPNTRFYRIHR